MNYRQLAEYILEQPETVQNQDVTIFVPGVNEYYPVAIVWTNEECDVLDPEHMILTIADGDDVAWAKSAHRANYPNAY